MAGIQGQLTDFLQAFRRQRWQFLVAASLVISVGVWFAVIVPEEYRLSTRIEGASERPLRAAERARFIEDITARNPPVAVSSRDDESGAFIDISCSDEDVERAARVLEDTTTSWLQYVADSDRESLLQERPR